MSSIIDTAMDYEQQSEGHEKQTALVLAAMCLASASNNEGAKHLADGDLRRAYVSFKAAFEVLNGAELSLLLQQSSLESMVEGDEQFVVSKDLQQYAAMTQQTETLLRANPPKFLPQSASTGFNKSAFFVYKKPFLFAPELEVPTKEKVSLYKAQAMFNLAMVLHQEGNGVDEASIYKALHLYDLSLECSMECNGVSSSSKEGLMLTIAALNNKAHIFHEFCDPRSLQIVLDTLYLALAFLPQGVQVAESSQIQGILFNVYMLRDLNCARAA
jgi:hypothetical protein